MTTAAVSSRSPSGPPFPRRSSKPRRNIYNIALVFLLTCCFATLLVNFLHGSMIQSLTSSTHLLDSLLLENNNNNNNNEIPSVPLAGLDCSAYGGPDNEKAEEMVYWSDIPSDNAHVSPFYAPNHYLTFEPDGGGWNNIRMSMETVLAMAHAMGRTLVLPPGTLIQWHSYLVVALYKILILFLLHRAKNVSAPWK